MEKFIISLILVMVAFCDAAAQEKVDTLEIIIKSPKMKNFSFGDHKVYLKMNDGSLFKDQLKIHDSIINIESNSQSTRLYLRIFNKRGVLYSSGLWNEEGFQSTIFFFNKNGTLKNKGYFEDGVFKEGDAPNL